MPAKGKTEPSRQRITVALPEVHFLDFGFRLKIEPIAAVQGGSIAEKAGFQPGDLILKVDGQDDFDPMRLPTYCYQHAGKPVSFEIERTATGGTRKNLTLTVQPDDTPPWCEEVLSIEPLEVPGVGLAYPVSTQIVSVREGSPAALAGLKPGMQIRGMTLYLSLPQKARVLPVDFVFEGREKDAGWPYAFYRLQAPQQFPLPAGAHVERTLELQLDGNLRVALVPEPDPDWYMPLRGFRFDFLKSKLGPMPLPDGIARGARESVDEVAGIYYMLRGLMQQQLSQKNFAGPVRIASMAYYFVTAGLAPFLFFLGMLSINLAVLNFLPIPPLDGGQMAFLMAEGVRGRPLPETAQAAGTWAGLLLVVGLMLLFLYQDILSYF